MEEKVVKAEFMGDLNIGESKIKAAVLEDGTRVLTRITFMKAIGRTGKAKGGRAYDKEFKVPVFLTAKNLKPFIHKGLLENSTPIIFEHKGNRSIGYKAELLPKVCGVFLDGDEAGALLPNQKHIICKHCNTTNGILKELKGDLRWNHHAEVAKKDVSCRNA